MSKSGQKSEHYRWRNGGKTLPTVSGRVGTRPHPQRTAACGSINTIRQNDARTFNLRTLVQNSMMTSAPPHTVEGLSELRVGPGGSLLSCNFPRSPRTPKWASAPSLTTLKPYFGYRAAGQGWLLTKIKEKVVFRLPRIYLESSIQPRPSCG